MDNVIRVSCCCGCDNGFMFRFDFEEEYGYVTISTITSGFYSKQSGLWKIIKNRIKSAWFMLCGREYLLHDIILDKEQWDGFVSAVNKT